MSTTTNPGSSAASSSTSVSQSHRDNSFYQPHPAMVVTSSVAKPRWEADLRMLETGVFSDFTVICGDKQWKTHRVILSRCPYFTAAISEENGFKESVENKITIEGFEEYEISWLLRYIYSGRINIEDIKDESPNKSFLEACVLVWGIGDYFCLNGLCQRVLSQLSRRCIELSVSATRLYAFADGFIFLPDIEAGIRAAWRQDRAAGPVQAELVSLSIYLSPYIRYMESFLALLDELPDFSVRFLRALLGCQGENPFTEYTGKGWICSECDKKIPDIDLKEPRTDVFRVPTKSLAFFGRTDQTYCSRLCYNNSVNDSDWKYLD